MLLVHTKKVTPRISYIFKHICSRILGIEVSFTTTLEGFVAHSGPKISYGKVPLGNELFFQSYGLLEQQGVESIEVYVKKWEETYGFFEVSSASALPFDIFSMSFFLLSRYEEYLPHVKDELGRFMASESLAFKNDFLHQPVVDIAAYRFKAKLMEAFPGISFSEKTMIVHPVIEATEAFAFKYKGLVRTVFNYASDFFKGKFRNIILRSQVLLGLRRDPFDSFKWLISVGKHSNFHMTVFFLLGEAREFRKGINSQRKGFIELIKYVADYQEVGLVFSFEALTEYELLKQEKLRMESITNRHADSSLNAEYVVALPDNYRSLVELEVNRDFTMVYDNEPGFRAGTCTPFLFYDLDYEVKTPLLIHPVAFSTASLKNSNPEEVGKLTDRLLLEVAKVAGTFTIIFSNRDFAVSSDPVWRKLFTEKLEAYV